MNLSRTVTIILICTLAFFATSIMLVQAQGFSLPEAKFLKDSVKIGEPIKLSLVFKHNPEMELFFADSSYDYAPFEFIKKEYYQTVTTEDISRDSVVYTLSTFELEPRLSLSLPIYILQIGDTSKLYSDPATVILDEIVRRITPQDSLKADTNYRVLNTKLNYPYLLIGVGMLIFVALITFVFFRKKLLAQYKLYMMRLDYTKFIKLFAGLKSDYMQSPSSTLLEDILSLWKKYLEKLEKIPYTTLTTKEIAGIVDVNQLTSSLQNFDRAIYGGYVKEDMSNSINYLGEMADLKYVNRQKEVRNV